MKKIILLFVFISGLLFAQLPYMGNNQNVFADTTSRQVNQFDNTEITKYKVTSSGVGTYEIRRFKNITYTGYSSSRNNGRPISIAGFNVNGQLMRSPIDSLFPAIQSTLNANYYPLSSNPAGYLTTVPAQSWSSITGKPTTLTGYGITDVYDKTQSDNRYILMTDTFPGRIMTTGAANSAINSLNSTVNGKQNTLVSGTNIKTINGNTILGSGNLVVVTDTSNLSNRINSKQNALGFTPYNSTNPSGYISQAGARTAISLTTTGSGTATYNNTTGVLNIPSNTGVSISINNAVARSLNSNYTISATRSANVTYSINISWNLAALLSGSGTAFLEYSTNGGSTWITVNQVSKSIGLLTFAGADDMNLTGWIPVNALVRIRTTATNMSITYTTGQETYY